MCQVIYLLDSENLLIYKIHSAPLHVYSAMGG